MRISTSVGTLLLSIAIPIAARAQAPATFDSAQRAILTESVRQMNKPADFVLRHRSELALNATQISALEALASAQNDSAVARQARYVRQAVANPPSSAFITATSWTGDVDVPALREALCQQSANQIEIMLDFARDRRAITAVLTPAQVDRLPQLQTSDLMNVIKRP